MKHLLLLLASAGGALSSSVTLYSCLSIVTNGGSQTELSFYGMEGFDSNFFVEGLDAQYQKSCGQSSLRHNTFQSARETAIQVSAFAKGHNFDDVEGCAMFSIRNTAAQIGLPLFTDPSFEGCMRINPNQLAARRIRGSVQARGLSLDEDSTPAIGDTIVLATSRILTLNEMATGADGNPLDLSIARSMLPQLSQTLGTLGTTSGGTIQAIPGSFRPPFIFVSFDAAINQGAGSINPDDWKVIVGSLVNLLARTGKRSVGVAFNEGGTLVLTVTIATMLS